ncbi:MAG: translation initiation factor IF-3 [Acidimicrobiales bacterium]|nr:translation initiation factor IF-3 [Acidimicrobiales bacterium]
MEHLASTEHDRDLDLVAFAEEAGHLAGLGLEVAGTDLRPVLHLLDAAARCLAPGLFGPLRLVDVDSKQLGIKPLPEALSIARQRDLDLVEVAPDANPPVCRIMDFNRFKYEAAQRAKESRRKATSTSIKEMKYRPKIGSGDFDTKTRQVARFLGDGHKVKITIMFRGREMSHPELGKKILDQVAEQVASVAKVEAAPKLDGRNMVMVLAPDRRAQVRKAPTSAGSSEDPSLNGDRPAAPTEPPSDATRPAEASQPAQALATVSPTSTSQAQTSPTRPLAAGSTTPTNGGTSSDQLPQGGTPPSPN